jgi:hypothetical protein
MLEGEVFFVRGFDSWPPPGVQTDHQQVGDIRIHCAWWPDGRLGVDIRTLGDALIATGMTQPLQVLGAGAVVFAVRWSSGQVRVNINNTEVFSWNEAPANVLVIQSGSTGDAELSLGHIDARTVCADKMRRRAAHLVPGTVRQGHRLVTPTEDRTRLERSLRATREYAAAVRHGADHHLPTLRNSLRELVHWKFNAGKPSRSYRPLLLRVATRLDRPLPIFALPRGTNPPSILAEATLHLELGPMGVARTLPTQVLMDLEDWLDRVIYIRRDTGEEFTAGPLLATAANKLGGSHSDPEIPLSLDDLEASRVFDQSLLTRLVLDLSDAVVSLGGDLLSE